MIVVTGAAGHVGGNLVRALLARGHHVRALAHQDRKAPPIYPYVPEVLKQQPKEMRCVHEHKNQAVFTIWKVEPYKTLVSLKKITYLVTQKC